MEIVENLPKRFKLVWRDWSHQTFQQKSSVEKKTYILVYYLFPVLKKIICSLYSTSVWRHLDFTRRAYVIN